MSSRFLEQKELQLSPTLKIKISASDQKCSKIIIQVTQSIQGGGSSVFQQKIEAKDFNMDRPSQSILFLKLCIEGSLSEANREKKLLHYEKIENIIWEKVVVGKDKINVAYGDLKKKGKKKYEGIALTLSYPTDILIILPRLINPEMDIINGSPFRTKQKQKFEKEKQVKKLFYATMS